MDGMPDMPDASALAWLLMNDLHGVEYEGVPLIYSNHGIMRKDCFKLVNPATGRSVLVTLTENGLCEVEAYWSAVPEDPEQMRQFPAEVRALLGI